MTKHVTIGGVLVEVVSDAEAERAAYVVCVQWSDPPMFPDNIRASCCACGCALQHRPHVPKKPARICVRCAYGTVRPDA